MIAAAMPLRAKLLVLMLLAGACEHKAPTPAPPPSAQPSEEPSPPPAPAVTGPPSYPAELNPKSLEPGLDCRSPVHKNACRIWKEFSSSEGGRFTGKSPSGENRWFGRGYVVAKGEEHMDYLALTVRPVPTMRVGPSSLPLMVGLGALPPELEREGDALWRRMSGPRHRGNQKNLAWKFLERFAPKHEQGAINTTGTSVQLIAAPGDDIGYLRQPELKRLLLIRPSRALDAKSGDGTYAEFWQATW